jgi:hypothetical protein
MERHDLFDTLIYAQHDRSTGELVVAGDDVEAHVWVCEGRVAWATSTRAGTPFTEHLRSHGVDRETLAEVLRECARARKNLIATLVEWKVASSDVVRHAQLHQICASLDSLTDEPELRALFLPKRLDYSAEYAFSIDDIVGACANHYEAVSAAIESSYESHEEWRPHSPSNDEQTRREIMATAKDILPKLMEIDGALGTCIVDSSSGMMLGAMGGGVNLEVAAAGNTDVVRAKRKTMAALELQGEEIEDILITLGKQYHLIRPLQTNDALFIYLVLDKNRSNLAMARHQLRSAEKELVV